MATPRENLEQALAGLMAAERQIISLAGSRGLSGLRFEWNDDIDFGHLQDPMPVSIFTPAGRTVDADFALAELAQFARGTPSAAKLEGIVDALTAAT